MPIRNGGFWDTGIAIGLMPGTSYAQARADKQADLQYTIALADMQKKKLQEKHEADTKIKTKFAALKSLGIEGPDQERVNMLVDDLRSQLSKKILNEYDGDLRKYMMYEGDSDLEEYTTTILNSPILQTALSNKMNLGAYAIDLKEGKDYSRLVSYKLTDGTEKTDVPFEEAVNDYHSYKTADLPYNGSFAKPKKAFEYFQSQIHPDPDKRYGVLDANGQHVAPGVSPEEYFDYLTNNGDNPLTGKDALELVKREYPAIAPALKWKTDDLQKWLLENAKFGLQKWQAQDASNDRKKSLALQEQDVILKAAALDATNKAAGKPGPNKSDIYFDMGLQTDNKGRMSGPSLGMNIDALKLAGISVDKLADGTKKISGQINTAYSPEDMKTTVNLAKSPHKIIAIDESKKYSDGKNTFVKARIEILADDMEAAGILEKKTFGSDKDKGFKSTKAKNGLRVVDLLIPIPKDEKYRYMFNTITTDPTKLDNAPFVDNLLGEIENDLSIEE